jgi:hypothetical protein
MARSHVPAEVQVGTRTFKTDALPDPFDDRDLIYRPRLQVLPANLDHRAGVPILDQVGNSCTGHAVAGLIDTVLADIPAKTPAHGAPRVTTTQVSPYMLYALARRYDEFPGTADVGSSLRGAFKGWHRHGVCRAASWGARSKGRDLTDPAFMRECADVPLGAYYRVNVQRIDDLQSAVGELNAIAVSAAIHEGWRTPLEYAKDGGKGISIIDRSGSTAPLGGHAFLIAGYNDVGFLIQNSWGTDWGHDGYATLPYEDWLDNAYDAWVARPGVPQTLFVRPRQWTVPAGNGVISTVGPDLARLPRYVVDVEGRGLPSAGGKVQSSPRQIKDLVVEMGRQHDRWVKDSGDPVRNIVLYAHGGLVDEDGGIRVADRMISWWLANRVYPVHIVWESGALSTILSFLKGLVGDVLPFGGPFDGLWEGIDRFIENKGRRFGPLWEEMKTNARDASGPLTQPAAAIDWNRRDPGPNPGVTLLVEQLSQYAKAHPGQVRFHLVGHSAGSVVLASTLRRLGAAGLSAESMQLMGGAITVQEFAATVIPTLKNGRLKRFATFDLTDTAEDADQCPGPPVALYHKSLLYMVARSLERDGPYGRDANGNPLAEVPMVGLSKYLSMTVKLPNGTTGALRDLIGGQGSYVIGPNHEPAAVNRCAARGHGEFDDDPDTLTAILLRMLGKTQVGEVQPYPRGGMPTSGGAGGPSGTPAVVVSTNVDSAAAPSRADDAERIVAARDLSRPKLAGTSPTPIVVGDPYGRALEQSGYRQVAAPEAPTPAKRSASPAPRPPRPGKA